MIKRLVWTIILLSPIVLAGFLSIIGVNTNINLFDAGNAVAYTWDSINDFFTLFGDDAQWGSFILNVFLASFFIAPLIFFWRGMFFIEWIPKIGHALRAIALAFIIFIPGIFQIMVDSGIDSTFLEQFGVYLQAAVLTFSMIGLWLPKSVTAK